MLIGPRLGGALAVVLLGAGAGPASADGPGGGVVCPPAKLNCDVTARDPGKPGSGEPGGEPDKPGGDGAGKPGGDGAGKPACAIDGMEVPCSTPEMGTFSAADSCYW
ncbi:hypothetical protein [Streptomyces sp. NBC_01296]|uniref:hypothetical protein n=1 Tax=Streptomyces sp. NBC_01296 TaxID=2903816 RepID=UPI002E0FB82B|nr:hypothetical protein OG299_00025 [Streptomyces sp. NBC_01296]WSN53470.1 hypothetical protein OG299_40490 [Streptomyces sp. NBC_01296]WSN54307.1 hypothetical protein OG299_42515 [Streptomyces sp. NBC_01296]